MGLTAGALLASYLVSSIYVASTNRPNAVPAGLHFVSTGAFETRFQTWGKGSSQPIVLLHGAFESVATWVPIAERLARNFHVEAYDLKGYGYTNHVGPYSLRALAQQLSDFISVRRLHSPVLVGHSLGAGVLAQFVLDHPHVASGIIFLDGDGLSASIPGNFFTELVPEPFRTALYRMAVRSRWFVSSVWNMACGDPCPPLRASDLAEVMAPFSVAGAESALEDYGRHAIVGVSVSQRDTLARWKIPSLVISGANDVELSNAAARETARAIGAPAPIFIPHSGHLALWSRPQLVAQAIINFMRLLNKR
ncbi:MAG: alpha/beta hydrolase [Actinomycetota bacterium]